MIHARRAVVAHAQSVIVYDVLLLNTLNEFAQCTCLLHATRTLFDFCSLCVAIVTSVTLPNSGRVVPPVAISHPHRARHTNTTTGITSLFLVSTCLCTFSPEKGTILPSEHYT